MTCSPTSDLSLITSIVSEPRIWRRMRNDDCPDIGAHQARVKEACESEGVVFVLVSDPDPVGFFVLCNATNARFPTAAEAYHCFLPSVWGRTEAIVRECLRWVWNSTGILRLSARIPSYNRLSLRLAWAVGFRETGRLENSVTKYGKPFDVISLSIQRPL